MYIRRLSMRGIRQSLHALLLLKIVRIRSESYEIKFAKNCDFTIIFWHVLFPLSICTGRIQHLVMPASHGGSRYYGLDTIGPYKIGLLDTIKFFLIVRSYPMQMMPYAMHIHVYSLI